jgi:choline kinase
MNAIILAAGRGNRLRDFNPDGRPKSLLEFGGRSLLSRELEWLFKTGIAQVEIVVGYQADQVITHAKAQPVRPKLTFTHNPRFLEGSVISLLAAGQTLSGGQGALIMDADVLFHPAILERLVTSKHANAFLLDRGFEPGDEPVKIAIAEGQMVEFRKALDPGLHYDELGESVGFFKFDDRVCRDIERACAAYDAAGKAEAPHEEVLRDLLLADPNRFGFEDVTGLPWLEVDFPADVERGMQRILPAIIADRSGF